MSGRHGRGGRPRRDDRQDRLRPIAWASRSAVGGMLPGHLPRRPVRFGMSQPCVWLRSAVGLIPEAVIVVFDQVWSLEQRVAVIAASLEHSPEQAGNAPQVIATGFRAARFV